MLGSGFPQRGGFPLIEGLPLGVFLRRDVDSSPPNTGYISVPHSNVVIRTSVCQVACIVLWSSFGGAGVHNR